MVDGNREPLGDARYLLSPGDLYTLKEIPAIIATGVSALKIEGRYKDADYVALTTSAYRKAVDEAWDGRKLSVTRAEELQLEQVYSRGRRPYFINGTDHQRVVRGRAPRHRGILMGRVSRIERDCVIIEPAGNAYEIAPLKTGDGVVFDAADWRSPEEPEERGRIYEVRDREIRFGNGAIRFDRIRPGDLLWRTDCPQTVQIPRVLQPLKVHVIARKGFPLIAEWSLLKHPDRRVSVESAIPLTPAQNQGISLNSFRESSAGSLGCSKWNVISKSLAKSSIFLRNMTRDDGLPPAILFGHRAREIRPHEIQSRFSRTIYLCGCQH